MSREHSAVVTKPRRSVAIDALRGVAIVLMVFIDVPGRFSDTPEQLTHASWEGLRLADFVFPCFLVASGAALGLSARRPAVRTLLWRAIRLFAIGVALVAIKYRRIGFESGTLQLIAVSWFIGALAMRLDPLRRALLASGLLIASVLAHAGNWSPNGIEVGIDEWFFGERSDLGLLCMVSASVAVMLASVAAQRIKELATRDKVVVLLRAAILLGCVGGVGALVGVPAVKRLWSPTYVLVTVAGCFVLWAVLEAALVAEPRWGDPLVALGRNALVTYVAMSLIGSLVPQSWTDALVDSAGSALGATMASLLYSTVVVVILAIACEVMRRRHIVIRI